MKIIRIIYILILFAFASCVEPYDFYALTDFETLYVVDGEIMSSEETQTIVVSQTSSPDSLSKEPVSDCVMEVVDLNDNVFPFHEVSDNPGTYQGSIAKEYFVAGNAFKLQFVGPNGKEYESDFQPFIEAADIDSVYYKVLNDYLPSTSNFPQQGVHVYLDLKAKDQQSEYYRYILEETYEYRSTFSIQNYWAGRWYDLDEEDWSYHVCYKTDRSKTIDILSTAYQTGNEFKKHPVIFISNQSVKLYYRYSLLIKQLSVSKEIYDYWRILKETAEENDNLFGKQPANANGNMICASDDEEDVLGFFSVSDVKEQRIFLQDVPGIVFYSDFKCESSPITDQRWILDSSERRWPIYLNSDGEYAPPQCFDCRVAGGELEIPEYWKEK